MKSILILLLSFLNLSFFYSCGNTEDPEVAIPITETEVYIPTNTTNDTWVLLSDTYVTELLKLEVPPVSEWIEDKELRQKYRHALLLKEYGDIPQVRTIIEIELNRRPKVTITNRDEHIAYLDKRIAYLEALMFISPSKVTQEALEKTKRTKLRLSLDIVGMKKLIKEDPELFVQLERDRLIEEFGDIPEVHTVTTLLLKMLRQEPLTDEEIRAYSEARDALWSEEKG